MMIKTLSNNELEQVNGGWVAYAAGAAVGAVGGAFGAIIAGNENSGSGATIDDIVIGAIGGAISGAASPISSIKSIVTTAGTGVLTGGMVSLYKQIRVGQAEN